MSDLQRDTEHWHGRATKLIETIHQVKDGALSNPFGEDAKWHERLSGVATELRLLSAWLARLAAS
jgi:hypothetical protein